MYAYRNNTGLFAAVASGLYFQLMNANFCFIVSKTVTFTEIVY
jgi:hypothetical protein